MALPPNAQKLMVPELRHGIPYGDLLPGHIRNPLYVIVIIESKYEKPLWLTPHKTCDHPGPLSVRENAQSV